MRLGDLEGLQTLLLPDAWQREAVHALQAGHDLIVDAPTGAGKTHVFERYVEQGNFARRAIFTVPTRALANDKYAEWLARGWRVGITTGDLSVAPHAPSSSPPSRPPKAPSSAPSPACPSPHRHRLRPHSLPAPNLLVNH